jgi:hypothetical protein
MGEDGVPELKKKKRTGAVQLSTRVSTVNPITDLHILPCVVDIPLRVNGGSVGVGCEMVGVFFFCFWHWFFFFQVYISHLLIVALNPVGKNNVGKC